MTIRDTVTRDRQELEGLSPFELKDELIDLADDHEKPAATAC